MPVLIVRTQPGADAFAQRLTDRGIDAVACPVTRIQPVVETIELPPETQAVAFTSANAVRIYRNLGGPTAYSAYAVGATTAQAAREVGFSIVHDANSDVQGLADLIAARCDPNQGTIGYPAALDVAGDLDLLLERQGYTVSKQVIYQAAPVENLPDSVDLALRTRTCAGAAFFSARGAEVFAALAVAAGHQDAISGMYAWCLSDAVAAKATAEGHHLDWCRTIVARSPTAEAMEAAIEASLQDAP